MRNRRYFAISVTGAFRPLFEVVMKEAGGNQSRAAGILGINRGTLRKKLKQFGLGGS